MHEINSSTPRKGNASSCWQRFNWTKCVRNLENRARQVGYAGARVYLATDFLSLRTQAERDLGVV